MEDLYVQGYKLAGDILVERVQETHSNQDILVYPIVFLYRQYIELRLKELIRYGNLLLDIHEKHPKHHKIDELWKQCRRVLEEVRPECPAVDLDAVEECINQFSEKDSKSMAFRYATDKDGNPSVPGLTHINLRNLSEVVSRIASLLEWANMRVSFDLDQKQEMEAVYSDL